MIVVDTSALMATLQGERISDACIEVLAEAHRVFISAASVTEALIVAGGRGLGKDMNAIFDRFGCEIVSVTSSFAFAAARAHTRWGRGFHPAALNFRDCFAYALSKDRNCPLLFVGDDFSQTNIVPVLPKT